MLVRVGINIAGEQQLSRAFEAYEGEITDMREPLQETAGILERAVGEQFATEGVSGTGRAWQPLSPDYQAWKDEHYPGRPLMVREGALRGELTTDAGIKELSPDRLVFGSDLDYAIYHQQGRGHNPARRLIDLNVGVRRSIDRAFASWLNARRRHAHIGTL